MTNRIAVSSAEFIRNIGYWQTEALRQPISITHHGRERLVLAAPDAIQLHGEGNTQNDRALAALQSVHAALLENLDESFLAVDAQLSITASNAAAEAFVGRSREQLRGVAVFDAMPQPLGSILAERLQRVLRSHKREEVEAGSFDGRHVRIRAFPGVGGACALFHNITEEHVLRLQLERVEALDAAVLHHSRAAAIRLDGRARVASIDEVFCRWSGFSGADVVGHRFVDLISPPQRREAGELIERVLRECISREIALTMLGKRGAEIPGRLSLAPILTDAVAHGAQALWVPGDNADEEQCAA